MSAALAPPAPSQPAYRRAFPLQGVDPSQVPRDGGRPNSREWLGPRLGGQHAGWDIPGAVGSPVSAVSDGRILRVGQGQGYGNMVDVAYADGTVHRMGHLQGFADGLHEGQTVQAGQPLGRLGYTGNAGPEFPHLHYEVFPNTDAYRKSDGISSREGAGLRIDPRQYFENLNAPQQGQQPVLSAYSPQAGGDRMEGGYASSKPGPDGQSVVRTLEDYTSGRSSHVTLAGDPSQYGKELTIPSLDYINSNGDRVTAQNVRGVVHDTGSAFKGQGSGRYDVAVGRDMSTAQTNAQPFSMRPIPVNDGAPQTAAFQPPSVLNRDGVTTTSAAFYHPSQPAPAPAPSQVAALAPPPAVSNPLQGSRYDDGTAGGTFAAPAALAPPPVQQAAYSPPAPVPAAQAAPSAVPDATPATSAALTPPPELKAAPAGPATSDTNVASSLAAVPESSQASTEVAAALPPPLPKQDLGGTPQLGTKVNSTETAAPNDTGSGRAYAQSPAPDTAPALQTAALAPPPPPQPDAASSVPGTPAVSAPAAPPKAALGAPSPTPAKPKTLIESLFGGKPLDGQALKTPLFDGSHLRIFDGGNTGTGGKLLDGQALKIGGGAGTTPPVSAAPLPPVTPAAGTVPPPGYQPAIIDLNPANPGVRFASGGFSSFGSN